MKGFIEEMERVAILKACYGCYTEKGLEVGSGEAGRHAGRYRRHPGLR